MESLLRHEKTVAIVAFKNRCQQAASTEDMTIIEIVKDHDVGCADGEELKKWMQEAINSADADPQRSSKHRQDEEAAAAERGEVRQVPVARQQAEEEGNAAAQPRQVSDQEEREVVREEIDPEHLFMWIAAAEGEIIGDL